MSSIENTQNQTETQSENVVDDVECCICYDTLNDTINTCVTKCGHKYCTDCFIKSMQNNNLCPICRNELYEKSESNIVSDEDDENLYTDDDDDDYEDEEDEEEEQADEIENNNSTKIKLEMLMERFQNAGVSYKDLVSAMYYHNVSDDPEYNGRSNKRKIQNKINGVVDDLYRENFEIKSMELEDSYSKYAEIHNMARPGILSVASNIVSSVENGVNILVPRRRV